MAGNLQRTVLCFVLDREKNALLMIEKKRGQGAGKMNVPGGKIQPGEEEEAAAIRETTEETGITPRALKPAGRLEFYFPESQSWSNTCAVFTCESFRGKLVAESEECAALWVSLAALPLDRMWSSDRLWLPLLLEGRWFHRAYVFDGEDNVREERIKDGAY
jgi:8-oxo-dGTP diphosphatase